MNQKSNTPDMDGNVKIGENPVYGPGCYHEPRIDCPTHDSAQRIPRAFIEPIQKAAFRVENYSMTLIWHETLR